MNQIIYGEYLDDEECERAQVIASEVMRQLVDLARGRNPGGLG
jgi:hypothetical protein